MRCSALRTSRHTLVHPSGAIAHVDGTGCAAQQVVSHDRAGCSVRTRKCAATVHVPDLAATGSSDTGLVKEFRPIIQQPSDLIGETQSLEQAYR